MWCGTTGYVARQNSARALLQASMQAYNMCPVKLFALGGKPLGVLQLTGCQRRRVVWRAHGPCRTKYACCRSWMRQSRSSLNSYSEERSK